jgi:hypothetical protein
MRLWLRQEIKPPLRCPREDSSFLGMFYQRFQWEFGMGYSVMPSWVLTCPNCKNSFHHSKVDTYKFANFLEERKPEFPDKGLELECPHCNHKSTYCQTDLCYSY